MKLKIIIVKRGKNLSLTIPLEELEKVLRKEKKEQFMEEKAVENKPEEVVVNGSSNVPINSISEENNNPNE